MMKQGQYDVLAGYIQRGRTFDAVSYLAELSAGDEQANKLYMNVRGLKPSEQKDVLGKYLSNPANFKKPSRKSYLLPKGSPLASNAVRRNYVYSDETGLVEVSAEAVAGKKHFSEYFDANGNIMRREDYDEQGKLKTMEDYHYKQGELEFVDFYDVSLSCVRKRNSETRIMEERTPEGDLIGILR